MHKAVAGGGCRDAASGAGILYDIVWLYRIKPRYPVDFKQIREGRTGIALILTGW